MIRSNGKFASTEGKFYTLTTDITAAKNAFVKRMRAAFFLKKHRELFAGNRVWNSDSVRRIGDTYIYTEVGYRNDWTPETHDSIVASQGTDQLFFMYDAVSHRHLPFTRSELREILANKSHVPNKVEAKEYRRRMAKQRA